MSEFTCEKCKKTFKKINNKRWNDLKAAEEMLTLYPETKNDPTGILCTPRNNKFKKWFSQFTDEQKRQMREDFYK